MKTPWEATSEEGWRIKGISTHHIYPFQMVVTRAKRLTLWDEQNRQYLDLSQGLGSTIFGHNPPWLIRAIQKQMVRAIHITGDAFPSDIYLKAAEILRGTVAWKESRVFIDLSGALMVEAAIKYALYSTKKRMIAYIPYGFHGRTLLTMMLSSGTVESLEEYKSLFIYTPPPFIPIDDAIKIKEEIAAVIYEPVKGLFGNGVMITQHDIEQLRLLQDAGALIIVDEILTAGRCHINDLWVHPLVNAPADIIVSAKGIGGGIPAGCMIVNTSIHGFDNFDWWPVGAHGGTFSAHPFSCAAIAATVPRILQQLNVNKLSAPQQTHSWVRNNLFNIFENIAEIHGLGSLWVVTFSDRNEMIRYWKILYEKYQMIVSFGYPASLRLLPPIDITTKEWEEVFNRLDLAKRDYERKRVR